MVRERKRMPLTLVVVMLVLSSVLTVPAVAAATTPPSGFKGMDSVDLAVNADYPWHAMTSEEATAYELTAYKDSAVYIAGNSGRGMSDNTASNFAVTVTEPGVLTFEYALSAYTENGAGTSTDYLGYRIGDVIVKDDQPGRASLECIAQGEHRPTTDAWETYSISIDGSAFTEQSAVTIYIAFANFGWMTGDLHLNYAAIRNVAYSTGGRDDVVKGYDTAMGTVTAQLVGDTLANADLGDLAIGSTYSFTATANSGYQFYGWMKHSNNTSEYQTLVDGKLEIVVDESSYYVPVFAATGTYVLRNGTTFYDSTTSLKTVIEGAQSGDVLVLLKDSTMTENITVPAGVTLYLPFRAAWEKEEAGYYDEYGNYYLKYHFSDKTNKLCTASIAGEEKTFVRLTVNKGSTLNINGDVVIGSVIGYASQSYQGHVSGTHGRITNNGTISINDGGTLKCYGTVDGSGLVYVNDGGLLKESFIIGDFAGGSNTAQLFFTSQMPFKRFSMQSVQCELQMEANSMLMAMMSVWASSAYNEAEVILVGDHDEAAFRPDSNLASTVALTRTYNGSKALKGGNGLTEVAGIGRIEWTFSNGLTFQPLTVSLGGLTVDTGSSDFTIPYNFKINLVRGTYSIPLGMRIMPGAEVTIESGATVSVGGRLMVLDGLVQTDMSGDRYPNRNELTSAGFSGSGELTVDGTLIMEPGSSLGGLVKSNGGGTLDIKKGVYVSNTGTLSKVDPTRDLAEQDGSWFPSDGGVARFDSNGNVVKIDNWVQQDGAKGAYDENTTWFNLPARIYTANGPQKVEAGKTYLSSALDSAETASYDVEYLYVADGVYGRKADGTYGYLTDSGARKMTSATETVKRTMKGAWVDSSTTDKTVKVTQITVAGSTNSSALTYNVTVACDITKDGANSVLSNLTAIDATTKEAKTEKYVFLVKYTKEGSTTGTTLTPVEGVYTVPSEANGVTIEACLLGDVNGDGNVKTADARAAYKAYASTASYAALTELQILAADTSGDGKIKTADARSIYKIYLGK